MQWEELYDVLLAGTEAACGWKGCENARQGDIDESL